MTAPNYELYRVISDYEALVDGFADRIEDLNAPLTEIDEAGGLTRGNMQKLLKSANPEDWRPSAQRKQSRAFGWETLGKALKGTGMVLVLVIDDERFAPVKEQLSTRKRKASPAIAGKTRPGWLFTKKKAREMGKKRFSLMTASERKRHQRKAQKASAKSRRAKSRSRTLVQQPAPKLDVASASRPIDAHAARTTPSAYQMATDPR